ncbi:RcnB family protein [Sphingomonas sp.]|uniref:RcnB family protein n=1 Tax=Sphingomonas sp. TaxID=28214 RepID=UPI003CC69A8F
MRTLITAALAAAALVPVAASAQSYGEVRHDRREVRDDRRDVRDDRARGDYRAARDDRHDLRDDQRETREDWRDYRRSHADIYRGSAYAGPRGYRYRPVTVGFRFAPSYYGRNYWVNDWSRYRLARPGYNQQYIRYGNDVVLVDIRSGRVLRVFGGFFY